jgi:hypothetical protein
VSTDLVAFVTFDIHVAVDYKTDAWETRDPTKTMQYMPIMAVVSKVSFRNRSDCCQWQFVNNVSYAGFLIPAEPTVELLIVAPLIKKCTHSYSLTRTEEIIGTTSSVPVKQPVFLFRSEKPVLTNNACYK